MRIREGEIETADESCPYPGHHAFYCMSGEEGHNGSRDLDRNPGFTFPCDPHWEGLEYESFQNRSPHYSHKQVGRKIYL